MADVVATHITRVRVTRYEMPLKRAYGTARGVTTVAVNFLVELTATRGGELVEGVGECQPRHALTGDGGKDRVAAWRFLCAAADHLRDHQLRFTDREGALTAVREAMAGLHEVAQQHADTSNRERPFRGTLLGLEIALLDVAARALGQQIAELLGKQRDEIGISISTISSSTALAEVPGKVANQVRFPMTRVKGTGDLDYNLQLLETVAQANRAAGREKPLWIDINEALDFSRAALLIQEIADRMASGALTRSLVMEGLLPKAQFVDLPQLQRLADDTCRSTGGGGLDLRIMPDEGLWDATDFAQLRQLGGCRAINIKAPKAGGLLASLDLAQAAVAADPDIHLCIGGMVGTSDLTAWALHNLARALPRVDYLTAVPPRNVEERISDPLTRYQARGSNIIARQTGPGLGARLRSDKLRPYVRVSHDTAPALDKPAVLTKPTRTAPREPARGAGTTTRTLVVAGDTSLGDDYLDRRGGAPRKRLDTDPMSFFEGVRPLVAGHDSLIVNLETVLADSPTSPFEGKKSYLGWDSPDRTIGCLKELGVDAVGLANNHTMDYGPDHLLATRDRLEQAGLRAFGAGRNSAEAAAPLTLNLDFDGVRRRVHVIGAMQLQAKLRDEYQFYADGDRPGVHSMAVTRTTAAIEDLRAADPDSLIILFPHWGRNYRWANDAQRRAATAFTQAGADLVIGHGSHTLQQCVFEDRQATVFSLGNFVFNSRGRYDQQQALPFGLVARLELGVLPKGWRADLRLYPIVIDNLRTDYRGRPVDESEFQTVWSALVDNDPDQAFARRARPESDELGHHISYSLTTAGPPATPRDTARTRSRAGWDAAALREATKGVWTSEPTDPIERVSFVTRWTQPGAMLVTMDQADWSRQQLRTSAGQADHDPKTLAEFAVQAGATALMTSTPLVDPPLPTLIVKDTRRGLWDVALAARESYRGTAIGVTGTVGKSTTTGMMRHVLSAEAPTLASSGNWNTLDSVAMTAAGLVTQPKYAVFEAAISGFIRVPEITSGSLIRPHCVIITAIGVAHADLAPTLQAVAEHKGKLLHHLQPGGTAVINADAPYADYLADLARRHGAAQVLTFGTGADADFRLLEWNIHGDGCMVRAVLQGRRIRYELPVPGRGMALNSLATLAAVRALGLPVEPAVHRLASAPAGSRVLDRQQLAVPGGFVTLIDDTKNAADLSMFAAFELLGRLGDHKRARKVAVLGNIVYLGDAAVETHARLAEPLRVAGVDRVFTTGPDMDGLRDGLPPDVLGPHAESPDELATTVYRDLRPGDVVLVKGSARNTGFRQVPDLLRAASE